MQFIVGRVVIVGNKRQIVKGNESFSAINLVIKKKMNGKVRNIAFKCYGRVADKVANFRINDKVEVEYFIYSNQIKSGQNNSISENWISTLQAKEVYKEENSKRKKYSELKFNQDDKT
jgi:hypothetical protein